MAMSTATLGSINNSNAFYIRRNNLAYYRDEAEICARVSLLDIVACHHDDAGNFETPGAARCGVRAAPMCTL